MPTNSKKSNRTSSNPKLARLFEEAQRYHGANKYAEAANFYHQCLQIDPDHADSLHYLGIIAHQTGDSSTATALLEHAHAIANDDIDILLNLGIILGAQQRFNEAASCFHKILMISPKNPKALFQIGMLFYDQKMYSEAEKSLRALLQEKEDDYDAWNALGLALKYQNRFPEALATFHYVLEKKPGFRDSLVNLANGYYTIGKHEVAEKYLHEGLALYPDDIDLNYNLALIRMHHREWPEAIALHEKILKQKPNYYDSLTALGNIYDQMDKVDLAEKYYDNAIAANPTHGLAYNNKGSLLMHNKRYEEAEQCFNQAIHLRPENAFAYINKGNMLHQLTRTDEAIENFKTAIRLEPSNPAAYSNYGNLLKGQGKLVEAMPLYKKAIECDKSFSTAINNYLFCAHYDADFSPEDLFRDHVTYARLISDNVTPFGHYENAPDAERKLRVGFISGDLREHPVAFFIEPDFEYHDPQKMEIFCYVNQYTKDLDAVSDRLKAHVEHWTNIMSLSDKQVAEKIREDGIDILIDLSGHTALNRLGVFAYKPAPIQCTWIGYFDTTGLPTMDYIITDKYLLPPEEEHLYVEKPLRMPEHSAVFALPTFPIDVAPLPALKNGYITFGSFNALAKITDTVLSTWADILHAVPNSRLYFKNASFDDKGSLEIYKQKLINLGITLDRVTFDGKSPLKEYYRCYNNIDIALDPFPYNGGTTSLGTLWMGVPLVNLKGDRLISHVGETCLYAVGHPEWIARDKQEYVKIAVDLAGDIQKLTELRSTLRKKLEKSPLCDGPRHAANLEKTLRGAWREWCHKQTA